MQIAPHKNQKFVAMASKKDELIKTYIETLKNLNVEVDEELLKKVVDGLGPSIYNQDSSVVSCSDPKELQTVKENFLIKKLGMEDSAAWDHAIQEVCEQMGKSNRNKYRAVFYYLLVKKFGKEHIYN